MRFKGLKHGRAYMIEINNSIVYSAIYNKKLDKFLRLDSVSPRRIVEYQYNKEFNGYVENRWEHRVICKVYELDVSHTLVEDSLEIDILSIVGSLKSADHKISSIIRYIEDNYVRKEK